MRYRIEVKRSAAKALKWIPKEDQNIISEHACNSLRDKHGRDYLGQKQGNCS